MKKLLPILLLAATAHAAPVFTTEQTTNEIRVLADGKLFCAYVFRGASKPYVYPLTAPDGVTLNREFPMREVAGESHDHPHHRSFWFAHGDVNGIDFWSVAKGAGTIDTVGSPEVAMHGGVVTVHAQHNWTAPDAKIVVTDESVLDFGALKGGDRYIDFAITLKAGGEAVKLGDTKEGTMALRLRDEFNFTNTDTLARNSDGADGKKIWGLRSRWVNYETKIDGGWHGVAMLDHPKNPLSPQRWHARDYGLLAVNPFGEKAFDPKSEKAGGFTIEPGKSLTLRYRIVLYAGRKKAGEMDNLFRTYEGSGGDR